MNKPLRDPLKVPYSCIIIEPTQEHTATVIWLHGLNNSSKGMVLPTKFLLQSTLGLEHVKFILPSAHIMKVTGNEAYMPAWFDCFSFDFETRVEDEQGLLRSAYLIDDIIATEESEHGIPPHRVVIGGFSQGSATALLTVIKNTRPLAGVFLLAGYVPLRHRTKELMSPLASSLPIFWGHGRVDPRLKIDFSLATAQALASDLSLPFTAHTGRLSCFNNLNDASSEFGSKPIGANARNLGEGLKQPGVHFITYEDTYHELDETELRDLGVWLHALLE